MVNGRSLTIKNEKEATQTRQRKVLPSRRSYVRYRIIPDSVTIPLEGKISYNTYVVRDPEIESFPFETNLQYSGRNRLLPGSVFLAAGNDICDEAEIR